MSSGDGTDDSWETGEEFAQQIEEMQQRLHLLPGVVARRRWDELGRSRRVFNANAHELVATLRAAEESKELSVALIQNVRQTDVSEQYFALVDQRLHNALSSAYSLVDHARKILSPYAGTIFMGAYEARTEVVKTAPVSAFVMRFRNYLVHYGVAPFRYTFSPDDQSQTRVLVVREDLLKWDGWTAGSRSYIEAANADGIHLRQAVQDYVDLTQDLWNWTFDQFEGLHGNEIDEANALVEQINLTLTGGSWDGRGEPPWLAGLMEHLREEPTPN